MRDCCSFAMVVWEWQYSVQREGRARQGRWRFSMDSAVLEGLVRGIVGGVAIPPVVARILSGDSTSPLTREARGKDGCGFERVVGMERFGGCKAIPPS